MKRPVEYKKNNIPHAWSAEENATLIQLWNEGVSGKQIAIALNKTKGSVFNYINRNREWLGLERRPRHFRTSQKPLSERAYLSKLDKEWQGSVPLKHWTITQSWSKR